MLIRASALLSSQFRSTFYGQRAGQLSIPDEKPGLGVALNADVATKDTDSACAPDDAPNVIPLPTPSHWIRGRQRLGGLINEYQPAGQRARSGPVAEFERYYRYNRPRYSTAAASGADLD